VELGEPKGTKTTLEVEIILTNIAGTNAVETCLISVGQVVAAQRIIAGAKLANEEAQNKAIDEAIQLLYPYPPYQGQHDVLQQLIYKWKDLILIAKTLFSKSMILQAVSILLNKSIMVVVLPLNQIGEEQAAYINSIGGKPCFLNSDTINNKLLEEI